jgi:hypothetical protein
VHSTPDAHVLSLEAPTKNKSARVMHSNNCVCRLWMPLSQVHTRYWGFRNKTAGANPSQRLKCLLPLLDMANHAEVTLPQ